MFAHAEQRIGWYAARSVLKEILPPINPKAKTKHSKEQEEWKHIKTLLFQPTYKVESLCTKRPCTTQGFFFS